MRTATIRSGKWLSSKAAPASPHGYVPGCTIREAKERFMPPQGDGSVEKLHTIVVGQPLHQNVEGHTARTDSPEFKRARKTLHAIIATLTPNPFGEGSIQAHHGGSIWVFTGETDH